MRKIITASVALLSVITLAACSGKTTSNSSEKASSSVEKKSTSKSKSSSSKTGNGAGGGQPGIVAAPDNKIIADRLRQLDRKEVNWSEIS